MENKNNDLFTIGVVAAIVFVFALLDVLHQTGLFSRDAALSTDPMPVYTTQNFVSGNYLQEYDNYVAKHFYNGEKWARIVKNLELFWGKREFGDVYLGKEQTFFESHDAKTWQGTPETDSLVLLERLSKEYQAKVMLVPTADEIWKERVPSYGDVLDQKAYLDKARATVSEQDFIDVYAVLEEHKKEEIYFRTDSHWTAQGAYYAYLAWWEKSGRLMPYYYDLGHMETILENYVGPLAKRSGLEVTGEALRVFEETLDKGVTVSYDGRVTVQGYYRPEYLDTKEPYGYFLGEGFGLIKIDTGLDRKNNLVVIGDSYANAMIPLIAPHYSTIYVVDLNCFHGNPWTLLDEQKASGADVLVLQSVPGFLDSFVKEEDVE